VSSHPNRRTPSLRRRAAALCLSGVLAIGLAGVGAPAAMSASLNENPALGELTGGSSAATQTTSTAATTTTSSSSDSKSTTVVLGVLAAAVALIVGIAFFIMRDARSVVPAGEIPVGEASPTRHSPESLRRRRAKAKAARRQRKRNR
jgi:hypothetical protein